MSHPIGMAATEPQLRCFKVRWLSSGAATIIVDASLAGMLLYGANFRTSCLW